MDDNTILREIQKQNRFVYKNLFEDLYEGLVHYAYGYLYDRNSSEDIVQETFIFLWEKSDTIILKTSLKGYLFAMVRNKSLNFLKTVKITDNESILEIQAVMDQEYDLEALDQDEKKIIYHKVLDIVASLPPNMQTIVRLRFISNYKYLEIAEEMGISVNTVKTQLKRAKIKIGELLGLILWFALLRS
ncbi:RNA polymerase sigma-70 factor, ECF subfamily [Arenibacter nanhaiticus]|uniref:RNA polymerase sigma-70 factor, ECF subfamily n=1 Tax=Arenibacter nanhaiticus TaxID=558155 RepID=A0A1M6IVH0_9FLAO|nr:sigma-70 family RNA polymerase sigma factor [Arenibacter nanhaiticus]SHJ38384.1 RNA polymerase sigma-70 factor, ECF subfamily [Arenibacter nanhaiticus]